MTPLEKLAALCSAATPGPWFILGWRGEHDEDGAMIGVKSGKYPIYQVASTWGGLRDSSTRDEWERNRADADLIATSRSLVPLLREILSELGERHRPFGIYDQCGHDHGAAEADGKTLFDIEDVGLVCEEGRIQTICYHCDTDDGEMREDSTDGKWPCPDRALVERISEAVSEILGEDPK